MLRAPSPKRKHDKEEAAPVVEKVTDDDDEKEADNAPAAERVLLHVYFSGQKDLAGAAKKREPRNQTPSKPKAL
jgi:hypothetical protein